YLLYNSKEFLLGFNRKGYASDNAVLLRPPVNVVVGYVDVAAVPSILKTIFCYFVLYPETKVEQLVRVVMPGIQENLPARNNPGSTRTLTTRPSSNHVRSI